MSRDVPEWIGKTDGTPVPPRVRMRVFIRNDGRCQCGCGRQVIVGDKWQTDHKVALINGGENRESNLHTLLTEHHKDKTVADVAAKSKAYRVRAKHLGIRKHSTFPAGRGSPWKRKVGGRVVPR